MISSDKNVDNIKHICLSYTQQNSLERDAKVLYQIISLNHILKEYRS
jgi:hypothetical protein